MSYVGNQPNSAAFLTDQFSGNGSTTTFTLSTAPAGSTSILVSVSGVLQDPSTYSVVGTTLTLGGAAPAGTGNISVRYLGIPAAGVVTTAYRTVTEFTATAGQTTFTPPSYTPGFIAVYQNGVRLGAADFTASNGLTVVLTNAANLNDLITTESFYISSVANAIANVPGAVVESNINNGAITTAKIASSAVTQSKLALGTASTGPAFSAYQTAANDGQSITSAVFTTLKHDTKTYDTASCFNNTSSTATLNGMSTPAWSFCPNVAGYYQFNLQLRIGADSGQVICAGVCKNGNYTTSGTYHMNQVMGNGVNGTGLEVSVMFYLNGTGDYVTPFVWLNNSGNTNSTNMLNRYGETNWFQGFMVRAA